MVFNVGWIQVDLNLHILLLVHAAKQRQFKVDIRYIHVLKHPDNGQYLFSFGSYNLLPFVSFFD